MLTDFCFVTAGVELLPYFFFLLCLDIAHASITIVFVIFFYCEFFFCSLSKHSIETIFLIFWRFNKGMNIEYWMRIISFGLYFYELFLRAIKFVFRKQRFIERIGKWENKKKRVRGSFGVQLSRYPLVYSFIFPFFHLVIINWERYEWRSNKQRNRIRRDSLCAAHGRMH